MERLSIMQNYINALREKSEVDLVVLNELEHEVSRLTYDKLVLIEQGRKYKRDIKYLGKRQTVFNIIWTIVLVTFTWFWAYHSISSAYAEILNDRNAQIAKEQERTADAEDRIHNVIEAWNHTGKELNECRGVTE